MDPNSTVTPKQKDWGRTGDAPGSAFSGIGRGKRGGPSGGRGAATGGRGASQRGRGSSTRGGGSGFRGRGGRGRGGVPSTTSNTPSKLSETSTEPPPTVTKTPSKTSDTTSKANSTTQKPKPAPRRRSSAKNITIPQITVPPPQVTTSIRDDVDALVEHVRAGALTPNGPITPYTPSHIDWAGDDDDDGSLPDLNDWGVNTANAVDGAVTASDALKAATISPILFEGLKSLPEPKVPEVPEHDNEHSGSSPRTLPEPKPASPAIQPETTTASSSSSSLHPSLPPKPAAVPEPKQASSKPHTSSTRGDGGGGSGNARTRHPRNGPTPNPPRVNKSQAQPGPAPASSNPRHDNRNDSKNNRPVSGGVSVSKPPPSPSLAPASPLEPKKGLTDSMHAPKATPDSALQLSLDGPTSKPTTNSNSTLNVPNGTHDMNGPNNNRPRSAFRPGFPPSHLNSNTNSNSNAPPRRSRSPPPQDAFANGFTFPSLSPSPISGHYPPNVQNQKYNSSSRSAFGGRNHSSPPTTHNYNNNYQQGQSRWQDRTTHHTPRHTPQHSREHSASRPVITGDAISRLARTIAGSPAKA